jgi:hypothetical protein
MDARPAHQAQIDGGGDATVNAAGVSDGCESRLERELAIAKDLTGGHRWGGLPSAQVDETEMRMGVDQAGKNGQAIDVEGGIGCDPVVGANCVNPVAIDGDVDPAGVGARTVDDGAPSDCEPHRHSVEPGEGSQPAYWDGSGQVGALSLWAASSPGQRLTERTLGRACRRTHHQRVSDG